MLKYWYRLENSLHPQKAEDSVSLVANASVGSVALAAEYSTCESRSPRDPALTSSTAMHLVGLTFGFLNIVMSRASDLGLTDCLVTIDTN